MAIRTAFTDLLGLDCPIALAPMAGVAGGRLAAAVSEAGGLGLLGGGYGDPAWVRRELSLVTDGTRRPWGIGFITWHLDPDVLDLALRARPAAIMLSFGDPGPHLPAIREAGARLICQVTSVDEAREARTAGADLIVAQGTEAGGHGGTRSTLPLVPAVVDAVSPVPVLAAGGIADGRGLTAALALGAQGVLVGTRFYAAEESLAPAQVKERLARAAGADTTRQGTRVFDRVRGYEWPERYSGRALRNAFLERWAGHLDELLADAGEAEWFRQAVKEGDVETAVVFAGECLDLIESVRPAGELVQELCASAERLLRSLPDIAR